MDQKCLTCPFRAGGNPDLRMSIEARLITYASQTCHSTGIGIGKPNDTHICRGARDHQLVIFYGLGILKSPTDRAWDDAQAKLKK